MRKLLLLLCISLLSSQIYCQSGSSYLDEQRKRSVERAEYWAARGYYFDPSFMTASMMDRKVVNIQRAQYWADRGYNFNSDYMTASMMDRKVIDIQRARYWAERGYDFNPDYMTASMMDRKVQDIQRASEYQHQGYAFDPAFMTASMMDRKVADINRAEYWSGRGYSFNPNFMTATMMDRKVNDIQRAQYWADRGYNFNPDYMTASMMDRMVSQGTANHLMSLSEFKQQFPSVDYQPVSFRNTSQYSKTNSISYRGNQIVEYSNGRINRYLLNSNESMSFSSYRDAVINVNASIARRDYGVSNEVLDSFLSADTNRDGQLSIAEARSYLNLFYGNGVKRYLTNGKALSPNEFWNAGGGDCEDWSIYIAAFFYTWNYRVYIGLLESETRGSAHAITLLYSADPISSLSSYSMSQTTSNPYGESIPPGYYIPVDYDEIGGLTNATDNTYTLTGIYTPQAIIGRNW